MPPNSTFPLYDRIVGGGLADILNEWRADGDTYETIARRLADEYGIEVTTTTVYRWMQPQDGAA